MPRPHGGVSRPRSDHSISIEDRGTFESWAWRSRLGSASTGPTDWTPSVLADGLLAESRVLAQGQGLMLELAMALPENVGRWETAVAASLVIAISMIAINLVLTWEL